MPDLPLRLTGLSKRFGVLIVTDGVSLDVRPGEIHAVIGPNGAGKTTLMHQISGVLRPDRGTVALDGRDVTRWPTRRRARAGLGRTFQITSVVPGFTAGENAALAAQATHPAVWTPVHRHARLNAAGGAALDRAGLAHRADVPAFRLSHGERRQLELAMALAARPRVLLLDEPLAGAGPEETARLIALLAGLRTEVAMLLVEHDMHAVFSLADRISVLAAGRLLVTGTAAEVRAHPEVRSAYLGEDELA